MRVYGRVPDACPPAVRPDHRGHLITPIYKKIQVRSLDTGSFASVGYQVAAEQRSNEVGAATGSTIALQYLPHPGWSVTVSPIRVRSAFVPRAGPSVDVDLSVGSSGMCPMA